MDIRNHLVDKLIEAGAFWSYNQVSARDSISDSQLIEAVLVKLDIEDIDLLFKVFSSRKIKNVWLKTMVVQGDYYYSLNRFYAWYYFHVRYPDRYLKSMITRHLSRLMA